MDQNKRYQFPLTKSRIERAWKVGFAVEEDGSLVGQGGDGHCILPVIESNLPDCKWSRLALEAHVGEESLATLWIFATDDQTLVYKDKVTTLDSFFQSPEVSMEEKRTIFQAQNPVSIRGFTDGLLYGQVGRYLFLWVEAQGPDACRFWKLRAYAYGELFYTSLPQAYQQEGEFFHRYLSVFSTLYDDLQETIDQMHQTIDVDRAPRGVLDILAGWLGLDFVGLGISDEEMRAMLSRAHHLLAYKGTRGAVEELLQILVEHPTYLLEQNLLSFGEQQALYGDSPYQCTILVAGPYERKLQRKLEGVLEQFLPARTRLSIQFGERGQDLDGFTYLDVNATVLTQQTGVMDGDTTLNGRAYLE